MNALLPLYKTLSTEVGSHITLIYRSKEELIEFFIEYYAVGIRNSDHSVIISQEEVYEAVKEGLRKAGIKEEQIKKSLTHVNHDTLYFTKRRFDTSRVFEVIDKKIDTSTILRSGSDCSWVREELFDEFQEYEKCVTERYNNRPVLLLCAYDAETLTTTQLIKLLQSHMKVIYKERGRWMVSESVQRLIFDEKVEEYKKFEEFAVNRELKMIELKQRIEELERK
jgi:hypothetical protein